jgi:hypothetical protein
MFFEKDLSFLLFSIGPKGYGYFRAYLDVWECVDLSFGEGAEFLLCNVGL